jgi:hypothetical protein
LDSDIDELCGPGGGSLKEPPLQRDQFHDADWWPRAESGRHAQNEKAARISGRLWQFQKMPIATQRVSVH